MRDFAVNNCDVRVRLAPERITFVPRWCPAEARQTKHGRTKRQLCQRNSRYPLQEDKQQILKALPESILPFVAQREEIAAQNFDLARQPERAIVLDALGA